MISLSNVYTDDCGPGGGGGGVLLPWCRPLISIQDLWQVEAMHGHAHHQEYSSMLDFGKVGFAQAACDLPWARR